MFKNIEKNSVSFSSFKLMPTWLKGGLFGLFFGAIFTVLMLSFYTAYCPKSVPKSVFSSQETIEPGFLCNIFEFNTSFLINIGGFFGVYFGEEGYLGAYIVESLVFFILGAIVGLAIQTTRASVYSK